MNIFINGRFLTQKVSGVQQFAREICRELLQETNLTILVPRHVPLIDAKEFLPYIKAIGTFKGHVWEQISLPKYVNKQPDALLLNLCNTGPLLANQQVCTIHDLAFKVNPKWFNTFFSLYYNWLIPKLIHKSKLVLTVSETVKEELKNTYTLNNKKILVVFNKVSHQMLFIAQQAPINLHIKPKNFYLMVGSDNPRKNFALVKEVFTKYFTDQTLVIVGASHKAFNSKTSSIENKNIINLQYVNDSTVKWLYKNAKALINPSLYEGFGIPNIEAMSFSTPIICSDIKVFKEVCHSSAYYFSSNNAISLAACITHFNRQTDHSAKITEGKRIAEAYQKQERALLILNNLQA